MFNLGFCSSVATEIIQSWPLPPEAAVAALKKKKNKIIKKMLKYEGRQYFILAEATFDA